MKTATTSGCWTGALWIRDAQGQALRMVGGMATSERKLRPRKKPRKPRWHAETGARGSNYAFGAGPARGAAACGTDGPGHLPGHGLAGAALSNQLVAQAAVGQLVAHLGSALPLHSSLLWPELQAFKAARCCVSDTAAQGWNLGMTLCFQQVRSKGGPCDDTVGARPRPPPVAQTALQPQDLAHLQHPGPKPSHARPAPGGGKKPAIRAAVQAPVRHAPPACGCAPTTWKLRWAVNQLAQAHGYSAQNSLHAYGRSAARGARSVQRRSEGNYPRPSVITAS